LPVDFDKKKLHVKPGMREAGRKRVKQRITFPITFSRGKQEVRVFLNSILAFRIRDDLYLNAKPRDMYVTKRQIVRLPPTLISPFSSKAKTNNPPPDSPRCQPRINSALWRTRGSKDVTFRT